MATNTMPAQIQKLYKAVDAKILLATERVLLAIRSNITTQTDFPQVTSRLIKSTQGTPMSPGESVFNRNVVRHIASGHIGTNVKYARRIEFGFVGKDKIGRKYNQKGQGIFTKGFQIGFQNGVYKNIIINTLKDANNSQASSGGATK